MQENISLSKQLDKPNFPRNPVHRVNWIIYILVIILSIIFTAGPVFVIVLASVFAKSNQALIAYFWSALVSAFIGIITGAILLKIAKRRKRYLIGIAISGVVSFLSVSIAVQFVVNVTRRVEEALLINSVNVADLNSQIIVPIFGNFQVNPIIEGLIVFVSFTVPPLLLFYLRKNDLD